MSEDLMQVSELEVEEGDTVDEGDLLMKTTTGDEITASIPGEVVKYDFKLQMGAVSSLTNQLVLKQPSYK